MEHRIAVLVFACFSLVNTTGSLKNSTETEVNSGEVLAIAPFVPSAVLIRYNGTLQLLVRPPSMEAIYC